MRFSQFKKAKDSPSPPPAEKPAVQAAPVPPGAGASPGVPEAAPAVGREPARPPAEDSAERGQRPIVRASAGRLREVPEKPPFEDLEARARAVYSRLLSQTGSFLKSLEQPYTEKYEAVVAVCGQTAEELKTNPALMFCSTYSTADDYLRGHTANTVLLALAMGLEAGLDRREMDLLGFCAMAHDIGMIGYSGLYNSTTPLDEGERSEMTLHSEAGAAMLDRVVDLDYRVKGRARRIILQTHERADGSGYPDRVSGEEIDPLAQIIGIADAYEAITHPRPWRAASPPPEAVKELIERDGRGFNARAVRLLIAVLSIYPPGSIVELSGGETARVLAVNRGLLTRPLVELLLSGPPEYGVPDKRLMDLETHALVSVAGTVSGRQLQDRDPKCAARLEMSQWWTDW